MDPDATLATMRDLRQAIMTSTGGDEDALRSDAFELAELVEALDEWLTKGGFLPTEWNAMRSPLRATSTDAVQRIQRGGIGSRAGN